MADDKKESIKSIIDVNNTQVDHANYSGELPFSGHNEFDNEVASTNDTQANEYDTLPESSDTEVVNRDNVELRNNVGSDANELGNGSEPERGRAALEEESRSIQGQVSGRKEIHVSPEIAKIPEDGESSISGSYRFMTSSFNSVGSNCDDFSVSEIEDNSELMEEETTLANVHNESSADCTPDFESHFTPISDESKETLTKDKGSKLCPIPLNNKEDSKVNNADTVHQKSSHVDEDKNKCRFPDKKGFKSPSTNLSRGEKALLLFTALSLAAFIASSISSVLGKPLCPDKKGDLISLAVLGTVAFIATAVSLAHFCYPDKLKRELFSSSKTNVIEVETSESLGSKKNW